MLKDAIISKCQKYRYHLRRSWREENEIFRPLLFIMLNPSTADAFADDPTIKKCITIAKNHGFNSMEVINLYAFRSTDPKEIMERNIYEIEGPDNESYCKAAIKNASAIVVAWGVNGGTNGTPIIRHLLKGKGLLSLAVNKDGSPKHPLYCKNTCELNDWKIRE